MARSAATSFAKHGSVMRRMIRFGGNRSWLISSGGQAAAPLGEAAGQVVAKERCVQPERVSFAAMICGELVIGKLR